ncbi:hypothetical protein DFH11DRAFT_1797416 [Phellopilus nigrolimitatus]|nr:hypothetical protein DFH11DRAFT_1797416 [Phellopilus nigrolimitatus]
MSYHQRSDGRLPNEIREVSVVFDGLDGVDGSARFGFGETKALASVSGPIEVRLAVEQASKATFEVLIRPLAGLAGTDSKALASALRSALLPSTVLTNDPRTLIQLVAQSLTPLPARSVRGASAAASLLRTHPALVAALINASALALLNASSFPLRGVVCAAAVGRARGSRVLLVDPAEDELAVLDGGGTFAFLVSGGRAGADVDALRLKAELVWSNWSAAPFDEDELVQAAALARAGALSVWQHMKEAVALVVHGPREMPGFLSAKGKGKETQPTSVDDDTMEIS